MMLEELYQQYFDALYRGDRYEASRVINSAVENRVGIKEIYLHVFQRAQYEIGRLWEENKISVAQEHFFSAATQLVMSQLYPIIFSQSAKRAPKGKVVASSVSQELHEIGLRMVVDFLEMEGWYTYYLGANTPSESILDAVIENEADILALSATMDYYIPEIEETIKEVRNSRETAHVKIMVGGYPFIVDRDLWRRVGGDATAPNAEEAVKVADQLLEGDLK